MREKAFASQLLLEYKVVSPSVCVPESVVQQSPEEAQCKMKLVLAAQQDWIFLVLKEKQVKDDASKCRLEYFSQSTVQILACNHTVPY